MFAAATKPPREFPDLQPPMAPVTSRPIRRDLRAALPSDDIAGTTPICFVCSPGRYWKAGRTIPLCPMHRGWFALLAEVLDDEAGFVISSVTA